MIEQLAIDFESLLEAKASRRSPYPKYKPSGVTWLPSIPTAWHIKRLKFAVTFPSKAEVRRLPLDLPVSFVPMDAVGEYGGLRLTETRPLEDVLNGYTFFRDGDVVIAKITPCFENGKGALARGLEGGIAFGTTELHVLRASEFLPEFLFYVTISRDFRELGAAEMYGAGGQKRVPERFLRDLRHPIPPLDEQRIIVDFLDLENVRIDSLIADKMRLIELLAEKRAIVITHAVTKGLNPRASTKETGIDWLGQIPCHWSLKKLKFVSHLQTGLTLGKKYDEETRSRLVTRPYLRVANVQDGWLDLDEITEVAVPKDAALRYELQAGDVLMTEGGDFDKLGRGYVWEGQIPGCLHQNHIFAVRPNKRLLDSHLLATLLSSHHGRNYFTKTSQQTTNLASTNSTKLGEFPVPLAPFDEQQDILRFISEFSQRFDLLSRDVSTAIDRLREYRSALITAAVTGRIDVSDAERKDHNHGLGR